MTMKSTSPVFALGFLLLGLVPRSSIAATVSTSFGVTATIQSGCLISAAARAYRAITVAVANAASVVSVSCTDPTPYNVGLSVGLAPSATVATRKTPGRGLASLGYAPTSSAEGMVNWDQVVGSDSAAGIGKSFFQALSVISQTSTSSASADAITVTVTY